MSVSAASLARVKLKVIPTVTATKASQAGAEAGVDNSTYMTPLTTKQQIDARLADDATPDTDSEKLSTPEDVVRRVANAAAEYVIPTRAVMLAITVPAVVLAVNTSGYSTAGDGGSAIYYRVASEPSHGGKVRSADRFLPNGSVSTGFGGWWELAAGQQLDVRMFGVSADNSAPDNVDAITGCVDFAISRGIDRMTIGEGTYALAGAPADIHRLHFIGPGEITGVYRKASFRPSDGSQYRSAQTFIPERHMQAALRTRRPVVLATDSLGGGDDFDPVGVRNGITPTMRRYFQEKFAGLAVPVYFRGIGGARFADLNDVWPGTRPPWYDNSGRAWLEYIRDLRPSLLVLSFGMNDGYLYNSGNFTLATMLQILDKVRGWDFECEVVFWTPMVPSLFSDNAQAVGKDNQEGRDAMAGIIRSISSIGDFGYYDLNRTFNVYRDGRDILDTGLAQPATTTGSIPFLPNVEARDYMMSASFVSIPSDFWTLDPLRIQLSNRDDNVAFLLVSGGKFTVNIYADANRQVASIATGVTPPTTGSNVELIYRVVGMTLMITVNGVTVYDGPILRYGGVFQPQFRYANNASGASGTFKLMVGQEKQYQPRFADGEVYGFAPYEDDGGNQVNHPTPKTYGIMASEVLDAQPWSQARQLTADERVLRLLGSGPGSAFDFTSGRAVVVSKPTMASQFSAIEDLVDDTAGGSLAYQDNDVGERMGLLVGAGSGAHVTLSDVPFNVGEGTLIVEAQRSAGVSAFYASLIGVSGDDFTTLYSGAANSSNCVITIASSPVVNVGVAQSALNKFSTLAITWGGGRFTFCVNGHQFEFGEAAVPTGLTHLRFGRAGLPVSEPVVIRRAVLLPERLSDDRLMARMLRFG